MTETAEKTQLSTMRMFPAIFPIAAKESRSIEEQDRWDRDDVVCCESQANIEPRSVN